MTIGKDRIMKFPPEINPATGRFEEASRNELIKQSIKIILCTQKGERSLRPDFGSNLRSYPFMEANRTELNIMERDIRSSLLSMEPDIEDISLLSEYSEKTGTVNVTISYSVKESGEEDFVTVSLSDMGGQDFK